MSHTSRPQVSIERQEGDEENLVQAIPRNSLDAVLSCLSLHWVNDLPGTSIPDGDPARLTYGIKVLLFRLKNV